MEVEDSKMLMNCVLVGLEASGRYATGYLIGTLLIKRYLAVHPCCKLFVTDDLLGTVP